MTLAEIQKRVTEQANKELPVVLGRLFDEFKESHIEHAHQLTCHCDYCSALKEYVRAKIVSHRLKRRAFYMDLDICGTSEPYKFRSEKEFKEVVEEFRQKKNEAKQLGNYEVL